MVMLKRLLTQRFGPLPDEVEQRCTPPRCRDLERWLIACWTPSTWPRSFAMCRRRGE